MGGKGEQESFGWRIGLAIRIRVDFVQEAQQMIVRKTMHTTVPAVEVHRQRHRVRPINTG